MSTDRIIRDIDRSSESAIRAALAELNRLRIEILTQMRSVAELRDDLGRMRQVEQAVNGMIDRVETQLAADLRAALRVQFDHGIALADAPLVSLDLPVVTISRETIAVAESFSADLIQGITGTLRMKINSILRRAVLGSLNYSDALNELGRSLESRGTFSSVAGRAEAILRTEMLRMSAEAAQMRMEQQAVQARTAGYDLRKSWVATLDARTRPSHIAASLTYDEDGAIPVDDEFMVGGEQCLYPRDPALSPEESINCRCVAVSVTVKLAVQRAA